MKVGMYNGIHAHDQGEMTLRSMALGPGRFEVVVSLTEIIPKVKEEVRV